MMAPKRTGDDPVTYTMRPLVRAWLAVLGSGFAAACSGAVDDAAVTAQNWQMLHSYCTPCHNAAEYTAGLSLEMKSPDKIGQDAEIWEKVVRKLRGHMMPPPGEPRPDVAEVESFVSWMEARLDAAQPLPDPGYTALHRLNRREYANAIKDLIALDVRAEDWLPVDGVEEGFDNVANALQAPPAFIDQYLRAARNLSALAIGNRSPRAVGVPYNIPAAGQERYIEGLPLGTRGGALIEHYFPSDGQYRLSIGDMVTARFGQNQEHVNTVVATIDGQEFFKMDIGGGEDLAALDKLGQVAVNEINGRLKNIPFDATAGTHRLGVAFLQRSFAESDNFLHPLVPGVGQDAVLKIESIEVFGPVEARGLSRTKSRDAVFICQPSQATEERGCAERIVDHLAKKAFRGLAASEDIDRLMHLYDLGYGNGGFEKGVEYALSGVLAHPKFLYRVEAREDLKGGTFALNSTELASRLSFFLWGTLPDDNLLEAAAHGELADVAAIERQAKRMLADPKSESLASSFAYQWLALGKLKSIDPDPKLFADVPADLRDDLVREATLFVDSIFRADRSVIDLLKADHTFLNETLARHYGINDVRGNRFRRVVLADQNRWGLLGKGAVLMASSYPNRTSPVLRGAWLLDHILGTPPAQPPPNVEALVETVPGKPAVTVRERLEAHRASPSCIGCHGLMDPIGFALENFDAVGRWRERDREVGGPIDATGVLFDGTPLDGPITLRKALLAHPEQFVQTFTEKLMIYALGRSLTYKDMPAVRKIVRKAAASNYRFSAIVLGIIDSDEFRRARVADSETVAAQVANGQ
jgi:hypothetical protein